MCLLMGVGGVGGGETRLDLGLCNTSGYFFIAEEPQNK